MDPISIITFAASVTQAAYTISTEIYLFSNAVKEVDEAITALSREVSGLRRSLDGVSLSLQNPIARSERARTPENAPIWASVAGALEDCQRTLDAFRKKTAPHQEAKPTRNFFKKSVKTWKLNLSKAEIAELRDQFSTHTNSLQISLQTVNILITGLSPANVVEDIGPQLRMLQESIDSASIHDEKGAATATHRRQIEETARSVILKAPELLTTGILGADTKEDRTASMAILRDIIANHERSLRTDAGQVNDPQTLSTVEDSSDSDDDLEQSLAKELFSKGNEKYVKGLYANAETFIRDGLRHYANISRIKDSDDATSARLKLAICCMYQDKFEEAELMLLILAKHENTSNAQSLEAYHYLAQAYMCLYDFDAALEHCELALKGRRKLYGKHDTRFHSSQQLLSLLYKANGDFITGEAYAKKAKLADQAQPSENSIVFDRFAGYSSNEHVRTSLREKKEALIQLSDADFLTHIRPNNIRSRAGESRVVNFRFGVDSLNMLEALRWAACENKESLCKWLISRGANPNGGPTTYPLMAAAAKGNAAIVKLLLDAEAQTERASSDERTALHWACIWGHEAAVKVLVEYGANVNCRDSGGATPLIDAACKGHLSILSFLLSNGADMESRGKTIRSTALLSAFTNNRLDSAELLINHGADINVMNVRGETPLTEAIGRHSEDLVKLILDKGAHINNSSGSGPTAIILRAMNSHSTNMMQMFLDRGADINEGRGDGYTAMYAACDSERPEHLRFLSERGADPNTRLKRGLFPLALVQHRHNRECVEILRKVPGAKDCRDEPDGKDCKVCKEWDEVVPFDDGRIRAE